MQLMTDLALRQISLLIPIAQVMNGRGCRQAKRDSSLGTSAKSDTFPPHHQFHEMEKISPTAHIQHYLKRRALQLLVMAEQTKAIHDEQARGTSSLRTLYLTLFNTLFATLWLWIGVSALLNTSRGRLVLFEVVEPRARWVQTLTLIEVVHAAIGTPSPVLPHFFFHR